MKGKIRVGVLFGGRSAEHEVSLASARNIVHAIDKQKYEVLLIGIDKEGRWSHIEDPEFFQVVGEGKPISLPECREPLFVVPFRGVKEFLYKKDGTSVGPIDVVFPVLHGTFGEDGTIQGLLKLAEVPFVGSGVLASAAAMDKDVMKRLLRDAGIPIARFIVFKWHEKEALTFEEVWRSVGLPFFVKPTNLGSSVGISKVKEEGDFGTAVEEAFGYDNKIIIEEFIQGREVECSVLGNEDPIASVPGEIIPSHEFYSYDAKYVDKDGARLEIPANLSSSQIQRVKELALRSFQALCCEGLARIDFFVRGDGEVIVNEVNTMPGFTQISMYPKLWESNGIPQTELINRFIDLALERSKREEGLRRTYF
jgi:D-alanine-D-alanine ligase